MKHKRIISLVLTVAMMLSMCMTGFAVGTDETDVPLIVETCTCTAKCVEGAVNADCPVCSADGTDLEACKGTEVTPSALECTCETKCADGAVNADCPVCSAKGADLTACTGSQEEQEECTCETKCTEGTVTNCPVCSADRSACEGTKSTPPANDGLGDAEDNQANAILLNSLDQDSDGVYQIASADDLIEFAERVNDGAYDADAVLTADIVLNENVLNDDGTLNKDHAGTFGQWTPIGDSTNKYSGTFDGNGHTISGIYIINDSKEDKNYQGFVGYLGTNGVIKKLTIEDSYLEINDIDPDPYWGSFFFKNNCGSICGYNEGTIDSCVNYGTLLGLDGSHLGGICGNNDGGIITNSSNYGMVQGNTYVGGICGESKAHGTVENCTNEGQIMGQSTYIGGICGQVLDASVKKCTNNGEIKAIPESSGAGSIGGICGTNVSSEITDCINNGSITVECEGSGAFEHIGGISGLSRNSKSNIKNCVNNGTINAPTQTSRIGGVCGANDGIIENCYSTGDVTGHNDVGGFCGNNALNNPGKIRNCYSTGTVTGSSNVGVFCGNNKLNGSYGQISNCYYYLATENLPAVSNGNQGPSASIDGKEMEQFNSGEVCYLLNKNDNYDDIFWVQNVDQGFGIDLDSSPIFKTFMGEDTGSHEVFTTSDEKDYINHIYEHEYSYTVNSENIAQIVQDCSNHKTEECDTVRGTATIKSDAVYTYDGKPHGANVEYSENWFDKNLIISYAQGETALQSAPIDAGDYSASITKDNETATTTFKIIPVETSVIITPDPSTLTGGGTVKLTVDKSHLPEGAEVTVSCNQPDITITDNGDGTYTVNLPNSTKIYTFTVDYVGDHNHMGSQGNCIVNVTASSGGGAQHPEYKPEDKPEVETEHIIDEDVPLAETPWLNTDEHYAYIVGYAEDGTVRPQANITRAEVATIFFRLLTDEARDQFWMTTNNFPDVAPEAWYNNAISTMVNAGIIQGYEDGTFRPNNNITRAEFAAIASRFMSSGYDVEEDLFTDIANHWARKNINDAAMTQWIHGYPDGTFLPDQAITRAEAVTLVNNVLQRKPHKDHMLDSMIKWPDNPESAWYYEAIQEATNSHDYDLFEGAAYEIWTSLLENRDWAALEKDWMNAHRGGGEVM